MAPRILEHLAVIAVLLAVLLSLPAETAAEHRHKKAALVRKLMKKSKINEATVRLAGGRVPSEGNLLTTR